ncbi:MAG TPA: hypothetical protein VM617_03460 [Thermoanaerobaculia bacterium]|nr:hypothetical protein [Thermoanaerobaculia bacterium]
MIDGRLHPYEWARDLLVREFGEESVHLEVGPDGSQVRALVGAQGEGGSEPGPYVVLLRDPVLGNVNGFADPGGFLVAEIAAARAWLEGSSSRRRSYG